MPWSPERARLLELVRLAALRRRARVGRDVRLLGAVRVRGAGRVSIGDGVRFDASQAPIDLLAERGAELVIGDGAVLESGCSIEAVQSVQIGRAARIGAFCKVLDNHFHRLQGDRTQAPPSQPVVIEDGAFVGPRAVLLPGAHVGRGARVGAASVLSRRIGDGADVHGYPVVARRAP